MFICLEWLNGECLNEKKTYVLRIKTKFFAKIHFFYL